MRIMSQEALAVVSASPSAKLVDKSSRVSKLEAEVLRMEHRGHTLIRREGKIIEGAALLQRSLWARARFNALRQNTQDPLWRYGEEFIVTCNHLAMNAIQTLSDDYIHTSNALIQLAERSLTDPVNDPFSDFSALRTHLIGSTLNNLAALQRLTDDRLETVVNTLHRALIVEGGRMSSLTLFNLAAVYVQCNRFDDACEAVTRCIELVNHYLTFPVRVETVGWAEFVAEVATHATLAHHLVASLALWSDMTDVCLHHSQLALACAAKHLGKKHALTSRCLDRLRAIERIVQGRRGGGNANASNAVTAKGAAAGSPFGKGSQQPEDEFALFSRGEEDAPPMVPLHLGFTTNSRPSQLLPFALAYPIPESVVEFVKIVRNSAPMALPSRGESFLPILGRSAGPAPSAPSGSGGALGASSTNNNRSFNATFSSTASSATNNTSLHMAGGTSKTLVSGAHDRAKLRSLMSDMGGGGSGSGGSGASRAAGLEGGGRSSSQQRQASISLDPSERHNAVESPRLQAIESITTVSSKFGATQLSAHDSSGSLGGAGSKQPLRVVAPPPSRGGSLAQRPSFDRLVLGQSGTHLPEDDEPSFVNENASLQQRIQTITPRPPSAPKTKITTVVPKAHLALYKELQREVHLNLEQHRSPHPQLGPGGVGKRVLHTNLALGTVSRLSPKASSPNLQHRNQSSRALNAAMVLPTGSPAGQVFTSTERHSPGRTRVVAAYQEVSEYPSSLVLKVSDEKLRELSLVRPDHTDEDEASWFAAAVKIQRTYRGMLDRCKVKVIRARNAQQTICRFAAETIWHQWKTYLACKPAKAAVMDRVAFLRTEANVKMIQRLARYHLSVEKYGLLWQQAYEHELYQRRIVQIRTLSIIITQSVARGRRVRKAQQKRQTAVRKIQRFVRIFALFKRVRLIVFTRRMRLRERLQHLISSATRIQRWSRRWMPMRRAIRELRSRQARLQEHFVGFFERDNKYWQDVKHLDDDLCKQTVQRWAVAFGVRRKVHALWTLTQRRLHAARTIQRMFRFRLAQVFVQTFRNEKRSLDLVSRRRQEFREAAIDIQRAARKMLALKELRRRQELAARNQRGAKCIQRLVRWMLFRRTFHSKQKDKGWQVQRYELAQRRKYAAVKFQSLWRMFATLKATAAIRRRIQFNLVDRHVYAVKIQRLARSFVARCRLAHRVAARQALRGPAVQREVRHVNATRIQSVMRMFLSRKDMRTAGFWTACTATRKKRAATAIQSVWRRYASKMYVSQLQRARAFHETCDTAQEHLHMYATTIQSAVRATILLAPKLAAARIAHRERAVLCIQRNAKVYLQRLHNERLATAADDAIQVMFSDEEKLFAALRIQKTVRGRQQRVHFQTAQRAIIKIQCAMRCFLARRRCKRLIEERRLATINILLREQELEACS